MYPKWGSPAQARIMSMLGGGGGGVSASSGKVPLLPAPIPVAVPGGFISMPSGPLSPGLPPPAVRKPSLLEIPTMFQPNPVLTTAVKQPPLLLAPGAGAVKPALLPAPAMSNPMVDAQMTARAAALSPPPTLGLHSAAAPPLGAHVTPVTSPTSLTGLNDLLGFQFDVDAVMAPLKAAVRT